MISVFCFFLNLFWTISVMSEVSESVETVADNRIMAYVGNWQTCPSDEQMAPYTHLISAFAVSYEWTPTGNLCHPFCEIADPPVVCQWNPPSSSSSQTNDDNNSTESVNVATSFLDHVHDLGKQVLLSFGGAGQTDCWLDCWDRPETVVDRLVDIVTQFGYDGVDFNYHLESLDPSERQASDLAFLANVTKGLRQALPTALLSYTVSDWMEIPASPDDDDVAAPVDTIGTMYDLLYSVRGDIDLVLLQYYNGRARPALDGLNGPVNSGTLVAINHYQAVVDQIAQGDASKVVFGFCIQDCLEESRTSAENAVAVLTELQSAYPCHGGMFFWLAQDDSIGWSEAVQPALVDARNCSEQLKNLTTEQPSMGPSLASSAGRWSVVVVLLQPVTSWLLSTVWETLL